MPSIKLQKPAIALGHIYKLYRHPSGEELGIARGNIVKIQKSIIAKKINGSKYFKIQRNVWNTKYKLVDENGNYLAHFEVPFFTLFRKKFDLFIHKKRFNIQGPYWDKNFVITDPDTNQQVIKLSKKYLQIREKFLVTFPQEFDERIAIAAVIVADCRYNPV